MNTLQEIQAAWKNTPEGHKAMHEAMIDLVNKDEQLKAHRDFVENHVFGFGERSFLWLWNVLVKEMSHEFEFLEIGVFKGAILSLIELLAEKNEKESFRIGVTPLSTAGGVWESDYERDIRTIHDQFNLPQDYKIIKGDSTDPATIKDCKGSELDILYIDGGHTYEIASSDIKNYAPLVKPGGFLVIDDCACDLPMPFGYFTGIEDVTRAVNDSPLIKTDFEFIFSVVHIKVWRRK